MERRVQWLVAVLILAVVAAGCSANSRPTVDEWRPMWEAVVDDMPTAAELGDPPDRGECSHALGVLRETTPELQPTPDLATDQIVEQWVLIAEAIVFGCPPDSQTLPDMESAYVELERLEAEVAAGLDFEPSG